MTIYVVIITFYTILMITIAIIFVYVAYVDILKNQDKKEM